MASKEIPQHKMFYGWIITGLVFLNLGTAYGAQYSFGVLFPAMIEEFKWNRQNLAGAFSLYTFLYGSLGIILGRWVDHFGPRVVLTAGSVCLGMGIGLISQVRAPWHLYLVYGFLAAWGMSATYMTASPTIVKWFVEKRGLALGIAQSGLGIGIVLIPPLVGTLISSFGWRLACMILGVSVFAVLFTTALFMIGHPEKAGLLPDGRRVDGPEGSGKTGLEIIPKEMYWSATEAMHTRSFWVLTAIFFFTWLLVFFPLVHLIIFALDIGLSQKSALLALSFLGGSSTVGRLMMGYVSDRIGRKRTLGLNLTLQVFSWFWILETHNAWMLIVFAVLFGFSYGAVSAVFPSIVGDYFGRLKVASVIGAIFTISGVSAAFGPFVGGYIYDLTHSYRPAFLLGGVTNLLALFLLFLSKPPAKIGRS
jgi:OFA family oxalate/formate antiporter-like MFS transporter